MKDSLYIKQTHSTNTMLWEMIRENKLPEGFVIYTDFQITGKGQSGNSWESENGKNLLFSMALYPNHIAPDEQFLLSQLVSVAIKKSLNKYTDGITVKWPNDIYWYDKKLAGILIESSLQGNKIKSVVIGVGLNVNQREFESDAPNPVSLLQIAGKSLNRKHILSRICQNIMELYTNLDVKMIHFEYHQSLYRKVGFHAYRTNTESFDAKIIGVQPDGQLELETDAGERKGFYFKEVKFVV